MHIYYIKQQKDFAEDFLMVPKEVYEQVLFLTDDVVIMAQILRKSFGPNQQSRVSWRIKSDIEWENLKNDKKKTKKTQKQKRK